MVAVLNPIANTMLGGAGRDFFFGQKAIDQTDWDPNTEVFVEL